MGSGEQSKVFLLSSPHAETGRGAFTRTLSPFLKYPLLPNSCHKVHEWLRKYSFSYSHVEWQILSPQPLSPPPASTSATSRRCCRRCPRPRATPCRCQLERTPPGAGQGSTRGFSTQRSGCPCCTGSSLHQWFSLLVFKIYRILGLFIHILHWMLSYS